MDQDLLEVGLLEDDRLPGPEHELGGSLEGAADETTTDAGTKPEPKKVDPLDDPVVKATMERLKAEAQATAYADALTKVGDRAKQPETPSFTPEQIAKYNDDLVNALASRPLEVFERFEARLTQSIIDKVMEQVNATANPALGTLGESVVESFLARQSASLPKRLYDEAVKEFEHEEIDRQSLLRLKPAERTAALKRHFDAAVGRVAQRSLASRPAGAPRTLTGSGRTGAPAGGNSKLAEYARKMGYTEDQAARSLRASFPRMKQDEALDMMLNELKEIV